MLVLVTGGAGFIGSHLVDALLERGDQVTVLDNLSNCGEYNLKPHLENQYFNFIKGDIRDGATVKRAMREADAVVHLAAVISVPLSINDPSTTHEINVQGTLTLLNASRDAGIKRFVYASSCAVYGEADKLPISENTAPKPLSPYAISKLNAENSCHAFYEVGEFPAVSLRYFNVYGPGQAGGEYAGVMLKFIERLRNNLPPIIWGSGNQTRDFIFVEDVVDATLLALERPDLEGEIINIGTMKQTSINELCDMFIRMSRNTDIKPTYKDARSGDIKHSQADISKAEKLLGFMPRVSVESGIKILWENTGAIQG